MDENVKTVQEILNEDVGKAIVTFTAGAKPGEKIAEYRKEYEELERKFRPGQVGKVQEDKTVGKGEKSKLVKKIRIPVAFQKKIVTTATAFEFGAPVTLTANEPTNELFAELLRLWKGNRVDDKLQQAKLAQKTQTESALHFYIKPVKAGEKATEEKGNSLKDIKVNVLTAKEGKMCPYFDSTGDMIAFIWQFEFKNAEGKVIKNAWIYDELNVYKCSNASDVMAVDSTEPHGFDRIPFVYMAQDYPEWHDVQDLIDRFEVAISKLGGSNDYSGYPLLKTYGEVTAMPDRNDDGKTMNFPIKIDEESGKPIHGDAEFLSSATAPESVKYEMEKIETLIYSLSYTPNLSFDNMKGMGDLSGVALKLMFLDSIIKAKMNEGGNRTIVERAINIFLGGTVTTTAIAKKAGKDKLSIDVKFNSILPNDVAEAVTIVTQAVTAGVMAKQTAVEFIGVNTDATAEIALIESDLAKNPKTEEKVLPA